VSDFRQRIEKLSPARLALLAIELQSRLEEKDKERSEPIAIVGMGCRMPGSAPGPESFWKSLAESHDSISEVPADRWDAAAYFNPDPDAPGRMSTKLGGFLSNVDLFDAPFFSIARREAVSMDPQQRLLLEVCWEALENSGHSPRKLAGTSTGVFVGICSLDYHNILLARGEESIDGYLASGTAASIAAGRISYTLGLQGPSMVVDTACSASLVAVHLACQSLRLKESRVAVAGGVNLTLTPETTIALSKAHMMAPDGRCKAFDSRADGFVRGEGCGIVVLKRLSDALADSDNILAVIRGSAVNQDGRSSGLTAPNGVAQEALLRQALASSGVNAEEIGYVEAHGTGTSLGDPIEAHALAAVLGPGRTPENPLVVGSVKTNVGHLESAAGVAGLIKVVLSLQHEEIPANLHFQKMNPHIDWGEVPVEIPVAGRPWKQGESKRVAGVSAFGFSGTNAHMVVEEAPSRKERKREAHEDRPLHIVALSGRSETALRELAERYEQELGKSKEELGDIAYTANAGRAHFEHRLAVVGATVEEVRKKLGEKKAGVEVQERAGMRPVFLFSGQGSQYAGMGKQLYETQGVFRKALEECEELLKTELEKPLREVLWGKETQLLDETQYTQPALFAMEYAIAEMWKSWGVEPGVLLGHSVGEYVAACVAGVYSLAEGLKLIAARGRLMQGVKGQGAMAAVMSGEERVREALAGLEERVSIAGLNAPESVVISGYAEEVGIAEERLKKAGVRVQRLVVSHGFHSPQMAEMEEEFEEVAGKIEYAAPKVKLISSVTGKEVGRGEISGNYWRKQVREPVRFQKAMETLRELGQQVYVEVGAGTTLVGLGKQCQESGSGREKGSGKGEQLWAVTLRKGRGEWEQVLESLGRLYERGAEIDWEGFDRGYGRRRVALPTYPFQRQRYWVENTLRRPGQLAARANEETKIATDGVPDDWYYELIWEAKPQRPARAPAQAISSKPVRWLIVPDSRGVAKELAGKLQEAGGIADVADPHDSVTKFLRTGPYDCLLHLSSLDSPGTDIRNGEDRPAGRSGLVSSVLETIQAMLSEESRARLWLITSGAQPVAAARSALNAAQAQVWGLGRTFALEHPGSWGGLLDLDPATGSGESASEVFSAISVRDAEDQLAFRNGQRYVARLARRSAPSFVKPHFLAEKCYVITGGLGALGLEAASWLVEHGARKLVLLGRRTPSMEAQKAIDDLKRQGARVEVLSADVASKTSLNAVFQEIIRNMGSINGVIHAAGFLDDGLLERQTSERMEKVLAPKVAGAWNLHELTAGMQLDFFVLFSSMASLTGSAGTSAYSAGNAYMDALAHYRKALALPALSVDWGAWEGQGMGKRIGSGTGRRAGITMMHPRQALAALGSALSIPDPQIAIGAMDWIVLGPVYEGPAKRPLLEHLSTESGKINLPRHAVVEAAGKSLRHLSSASPEERKSELVRYLLAAVAPILAIELSSIDPYRPLTDFGLDSLMALEFKNRIGNDFGVSIPSVRLLQGPSLYEIASLIASELPLATTHEAQRIPAQQNADGAGKTPLNELRITPVKKRRDWLIRYLIEALAPILGVAASSLSAQPPITDFGLDSLMALEFKNRIGADFGVSIPSVRLLQGPSLDEIASQIATEIPADAADVSLAEISDTADVIEYPLSFIQQQSLFGHKLLPDTSGFCLSLTMKASPCLDWTAFERAVKKVTERHVALRTGFIEPDDAPPVQRILSPEIPHAFLIDASAWSDAELSHKISIEFQRPCDLERSVFQVFVFRRPEADAIYIKVDHLVFDMWSARILFEDLRKFYAAELKGTEIEMQKPQAEFREFVEWEAKMVEGPEGKRHWDYWNRKLGGDLPVLRLPCSRPRPKVVIDGGEIVPFKLDSSILVRVREAARRHKTTPYSFMLSVFLVMLYQYSGQDDLVVGTSSSGRENPRWADTIGYFINLLPLRTDLSGSPTFQECLARAHETVMGALEHQDFPFALILNRLRLHRNLQHSPVFQAFFNFLSDRSRGLGLLFKGVPGSTVEFAGSTLEPWVIKPLLGSGGFDLYMEITEADGQIVRSDFAYNTNVLDRTTAESMAAAYGKILEAAVRDHNIPIEKLGHEAEQLGSEREEIAI